MVFLSHVKKQKTSDEREAIDFAGPEKYRFVRRMTKTPGWRVPAIRRRLAGQKGTQGQSPEREPGHKGVRAQPASLARVQDRSYKSEIHEK